ncbi:MAG: hypothetical protein D6705_06180, partial [Deltaproteobacteria bacterium]
MRIDAVSSPEGMTRLEIATTDTPWVHLRIGVSTPYPEATDPATVHALAILDLRFERVTRGLAVASDVRAVLGRREWHAAATPDAARRLAARLARHLAAPIRRDELAVAAANLARRAHERCFVRAVEMAVAHAAGRGTAPAPSST